MHPFPCNFIVTILVLYQYTEGHRATVSLSNPVVAEGGSVSVSCHTETEDQEVSPVTVLVKHLHQSEGQRLADRFPALLTKDRLGGMQSTELATNHFPNEDVARTGRHRCSYHLASPGDYTRIEYRLAIENASTEDFGYYSCRMSLGNQTVESDAHLLQVVSPVAEVRWSEYDPSSDSWHHLRENETLTADEDKYLTVRCETEGGFPKPTHAVVVQPDGSGQALDITSHFREKAACPLGKGPKGLQKLLTSSTLTPADRVPVVATTTTTTATTTTAEDKQANDDEEDEEEEEEQGLQEQGNEMEEEEEEAEEEEADAEGRMGGLRAVYSYHERRVVCSAEVAQYGGEKPRKKSASIFVELSKFRPKFLCEDKMAVEPNAQNFSIACTVRARPGIRRLKIFVNGSSVPVDQRNGEYAADMEAVNGTDDEEVRSTLTIYRVSWKHFGKYEFLAINDFGNSTHVVELIRDNKNQKTLYQKSQVGSSSSRTTDFGRAVATSVAAAALAAVASVALTGRI